ncbi:HMA2 domain-containing protein [Massilia horti]|uniref:HMA2 domain-containing protein n=1 Tax=Massilia horti TaxID=2562153 RepID=UPI0027D95D8D|nr:hypothetical protein [Massilia horti]
MTSLPKQYPGRLRLRFPQLRGAPLAAAEVAASLRQVTGVVAVEASPLTGSLLVSYRIDGRAEARLLPALRQVLERHGLSCHHERAPRHGAGRAAPAPGIDALAAKLTGAVVDKLVERSALALVAALL